MEQQQLTTTIAAPAVRAVDDLHNRAASSNASDIHIEPVIGGARIRQRIDGVLFETGHLSSDLYAQVVSRVKVLAGMDIAERRQPQDGRYTIDDGGRSFDARVSSVPTILGEKVVIRILDRQARVPDLAALGMPVKLLEVFRKAVCAPHGFIVACGPTGSGKTTTLYAAMAERNVQSQSLCSVEDPIELRIPGIAQVQVNPRAGITFASALRAFLRQDPNVIMVGEMRDEETATVAATASLCGQLVMTTMHSNDALCAVDRLIELGVSRHTISAGLSAIVAQRLVRRLCLQCRIPLPSGAYCAAGCAACAQTGYAGRTAIFEAVFLNDEMRRMIADGGSHITFGEAARRSGYEPIVTDGVRRIALGETSLEEVRRVLAVDAAA